MAVFYRQEMAVGEAAVELGSLILMAKMGSDKGTMGTITLMSCRTSVVIGARWPVGIVALAN